MLCFINHKSFHNKGLNKYFLKISKNLLHLAEIRVLT